MEYKTGQLAKFSLKDGREYEGRIISIKEDRILIKLKNGYNVGIFKENINDAEPIQEKSVVKKSGRKTIQNKDLPKLTILHMGGTIASKVDYELGGVSPLFEPEEIISLFPELSNLVDIESKVVSKMLSENLRFSDLNNLVSAIKDALNSEKRPKGIIITHGTDMLHYTSAALSFLIENPPLPIILVGSQRSSDRPSSDSRFNLMAAVHFILKSESKGVFICIHESSSDDNCIILRGTNARKMHSSRRDAFKPINTEALARISLTDYRIEWLSHQEEQKNEATKFYAMNPKLKIGMFYVHPSMCKEELEGILKMDGAIIIGTGLGHIGLTDENEFILKLIQEAISKGVVIAIAPQTLFGRINLNVYSTGRKLKELGILGHESNMLPETAFMKLAFLMSNFKKERVYELYNKNLRGELSMKSPYEADYIDAD